MPQKIQPYTNRLCRATISEDGTILRGKSFNANFKGRLSKKRIEDEVISWLRAKDWMNELPIFIYSYYSVYTPGSSFQDIIRERKSPSTNKHGRKQFIFFIGKDLKIFDISGYMLHEEDVITLDHLTNQL